MLCGDLVKAQIETIDSLLVFFCLWWQVFAQSCLRTFCVAVRSVGEAQWVEWSRVLRQGAMATAGQESMLEELHDRMERELTV